jgi:hypothetical protein
MFFDDNIIGCALSAPDGSSPRGYSQIFLGIDSKNDSSFTRLNFCRLLYPSNHLWNVHPTSPWFTIVYHSLYSCIYDVINLFTIISRFLTVTHGQCGNFSISLPVSGLPFPLFAP